MNFKAQVERDLTAVFHNAREHADVMEFWIDGVRYKGPVIIDDGGAQDRKKPSMRRGEVNRLVIGPKAYGTNKWVITKLSNSLKRFDRWGNLLVASVNVTMQSYAVR